METKELLSYCWKHRLFGECLKTTNGKSLEITDQGLFDRRHGSRFFNAKVKIDNMLFVGNVLVLTATSEFYESFKDYKEESTNTILVLCNFVNGTCVDANGWGIHVLEAEIPEKVTRNYDALKCIGGDMLCHYHIMQYVPNLARHAWLSAMQTEFLENESDYLSRYYKECGKDLEETFLCAVLRAFGFNVNKVVMDLLARNLSLDALNKHRDDLFQIEAILFGQAGLLEISPEQQCALPEKYYDKAMKEGYFSKLRNEYIYLRIKYNMPWPLSRLSWHPYGKGAHAYPHTYLSMIANLWYKRLLSDQIVLAVETAKDAMNLFDTHCTPYWESHNIFGAVHRKFEKHLSDDRKSWLVMAAVVPFLFFYGRLMSREDLCDRAFDMMDQLKQFSTAETNYFRKCGVECRDAGESLALTHLKNEYCSNKNCLRCRFGYEFIKKH